MFFPPCAPGTTLAFVDDTDFHGDSVSRLAPDLRVLAAVKLDSGRYAEIDAALTDRLRELSQIEFHGAEVCNPEKGSRWRDVSVSDRIAMFNFMSSLVERSGASMLYSYISDGQYEQMRRDRHRQGNADFGVNRNAALKRVMLRSLQEELYAEGQPAMIMIDQDRARSGWVVDNRRRADLCAAESIILAGEFFPAACIDIHKPGGVRAPHRDEGGITLGVDGKNCGWRQGLTGIEVECALAWDRPNRSAKGRHDSLGRAIAIRCGRQGDGNLDNPWPADFAERGQQFGVSHPH